MNPRIERARRLGSELGAAMDALGGATRGAEVVVFLDRLARLEAFPPAELSSEPDLQALIATAQAARAEHHDVLGRLAGDSFDLDQMLDDGRHLPPGDGGAERDVWLRDVLMLATVAPWFTAARRRQVGWTLDGASALVEGEAGEFLDASVLAFDRHALEAPDALSPEARAFLATLVDLSLLASFDRLESKADPRRVDAVLRTVDRHQLLAAEDGLADHDSRGMVRLPGPPPQLALAAADESIATLLRMEAGAWLVSRHRGRLRIAFEGDAAHVVVEVLDGAEEGALVRDPAGWFVLPDSEEGLTLRLVVGPDSRTLRLDRDPG